MLTSQRFNLNGLFHFFVKVLVAVYGFEATGYKVSRLGCIWFREYGVHGFGGTEYGVHSFSQPGGWGGQFRSPYYYPTQWSRPMATSNSISFVRSTTHLMPKSCLTWLLLITAGVFDPRRRVRSPGDLKWAWLACVNFVINDPWLKSAFALFSAKPCYKPRGSLNKSWRPRSLQWYCIFHVIKQLNYWINAQLGQLVTILIIVILYSILYILYRQQ